MLVAARAVIPATQRFEAGDPDRPSVFPAFAPSEFDSLITTTENAGSGTPAYEFKNLVQGLEALGGFKEPLDHVVNEILPRYPLLWNAVRNEFPPPNGVELGHTPDHRIKGDRAFVISETARKIFHASREVRTAVNRFLKKRKLFDASESADQHYDRFILEVYDRPNLLKVYAEFLNSHRGVLTIMESNASAIKREASLYKRISELPLQLNRAIFAAKRARAALVDLQNSVYSDQGQPYSRRLDYLNQLLKSYVSELEIFFRESQQSLSEQGETLREAVREYMTLDFYLESELAAESLLTGAPVQFPKSFEAFSKMYARVEKISKGEDDYTDWE